MKIVLCILTAYTALVFVSATAAILVNEETEKMWFKIVRSFSVFIMMVVLFLLMKASF